MIKTSNDTHVYIVNQILKSLEIDYRTIKFKKRNLYFCELPDGHTFDLCVGTDQTLKIWSFFGSVPVKDFNVRYMYKKSNDSSPTVGIEITDEGDICFYVLQNLDIKNQKSRIRLLIEGYSKVISDPVFQVAKM